MSLFRPNFYQTSVLIVVVTHLVGTVGFLSPWSAGFIAITPLHLLLSSGLLLANHSEKSKAFLIAVLLLIAAGYFVEVAGVQTGVIFGAYHYDTTLGPKIWDTPPMIGVNWMMLLVAVSALTIKINVPHIIRAMIGAMIMVFIDFLIEPVAIKYDFWHWEMTSVPTHNYLGWLVTAFILFLAYLYAPFKKENKLAPVLLVAQLIFFGILNLI